VPLGIGMRKDEPQLKAWLNDWIAKNQDRLTELHKKFHGN
jgi:polar amino acid transport system substrate-binding protein